MYRFLAVSLLLSGCDRHIVFPDTGEPEVHACLELHQSSLDFGTVLVGDPPTRQTLLVGNTCDEDLGIDDIRVDAPFSLAVLGDMLVPPGSSTEVVVGFEPQGGGSWSTPLELRTTDPLTPVQAITLKGEALAASLEVTPISWDAGAPFIGCERLVDFTLTSSGTAPVEIQEVYLASECTDFKLELRRRENGELPWTMEPGESAQVTLHYLPMDEYQDQAVLYITSTDVERSLRTVQIQADGEVYDRSFERFEVEAPEELDLLLTVDRSPSMSTDLDRILPALDGVLEELLDGPADMDWRLGAVVADSGCLLDEPVDSSLDLSEASERLASLVDRYREVDHTEELWESGFRLALSALDADTTGGCNRGFFRETASLHLVHISDDGEQSDLPPSNYLADLASRKGDSSLVTVHAFTGELPKGCDDALAGQGYVQAANASDGLTRSICLADPEPALRTMVQVAEGRPRFLVLEDQPVPGTLGVKSAGAELPDWSWDPAQNAVIFEDGALPEVDSYVIVSYHVMPPTCE